jgi:hypothetical protein
MERLNDFVAYLVANPIFLIPILVVVASVTFAVLKRLVKTASIIAIAGVLYLILLEYFGKGT